MLLNNNGLPSYENSGLGGFLAPGRVTAKLNPGLISPTGPPSVMRWSGASSGTCGNQKVCALCVCVVVVVVVVWLCVRFFVLLSNDCVFVLFACVHVCV